MFVERRTTREEKNWIARLNFFFFSLSLLLTNHSSRCWNKTFQQLPTSVCPRQYLQRASLRPGRRPTRPPPSEECCAEKPQVTKHDVFQTDWFTWTRLHQRDDMGSLRGKPPPQQLFPETSLFSGRFLCNQSASAGRCECRGGRRRCAAQSIRAEGQS